MPSPVHSVRRWIAACWHSAYLRRDIQSSFHQRYFYVAPREQTTSSKFRTRRGDARRDREVPSRDRTAESTRKCQPQGGTIPPIIVFLSSSEKTGAVVVRHFCWNEAMLKNVVYEILSLRI